jgi:hypothetical protein
MGMSDGKLGWVIGSPTQLVSYFKIVFSVLTGFSVNFTLRKQAVGIYLESVRRHAPK